MSKDLEVNTSFSASISLNDLMRISSGTMALSLAARTSASIAASFPISICFLSDFTCSFVSSEIKKYSYKLSTMQCNTALFNHLTVTQN
jgi:hypothetical protein